MDVERFGLWIFVWVYLDVIIHLVLDYSEQPLISSIWILTLGETQTDRGITH